MGVDPDAVSPLGLRRPRRHLPATDAIVAGETASTSCPQFSTSPRRVGAAAEADRFEALTTALAPLRDRYDVIVPDCSPSLGVLTLAALTAADGLVILMPAEMLGHRGVGQQLLDTVSDLQRTHNPRLRIVGILPTLYDGRSNHARAVLADVGERYAVPVLPPIPRSVRFAEAPALGRTVLTTASRSRGAAAYRGLAAVVIEREGCPDAAEASSQNCLAGGLPLPARWSAAYWRPLLLAACSAGAPPTTRPRPTRGTALAG